MKREIELLNFLEKRDYFLKEEEIEEIKKKIKDVLGKEVIVTKEKRVFYDVVDYNDLAEGVMDLSSDAVGTYRVTKEVLVIKNRNEIINKLKEIIKRELKKRIDFNNVTEIFFSNIIRRLTDPDITATITEKEYYNEFRKFHEKTGTIELKKTVRSEIFEELLKETGTYIEMEEFYVLFEVVDKLEDLSNLSTIIEIFESRKEKIQKLVETYRNIKEGINKIEEKIKEIKTEIKRNEKEFIKQLFRKYSDNVLFNKSVTFSEKEEFFKEKLEEVGIKIKRIFFNFREKKISLIKEERLKKIEEEVTFKEILTAETEIIDELERLKEEKNKLYKFLWEIEDRNYISDYLETNSKFTIESVRYLLIGLKKLEEIEEEVRLLKNVVKFFRKKRLL